MEKEILTPHTHNGSILQSIKDNGDVVADADADLGQIKTVGIMIDTDIHQPMKLIL